MRLVRVRLATPLGRGDRELFPFTNRPADEVSAVRVAEPYRERWRLEGAFQVAAEAMPGEVASLGCPKAALFAMVGYNVVVASKRFAAALRVPATDVSDAAVATEVRAVTVGMGIAGPDARWVRIGSRTAAEWAAWLARLMAGLHPAKYLKTRRGPKTPPTAKKNGSSGHVATHRPLQTRRTATPKPP